MAVYERKWQDETCHYSHMKAYRPVAARHGLMEKQKYRQCKDKRKRQTGAALVMNCTSKAGIAIS